VHTLDSDGKPAGDANPFSREADIRGRSADERRAIRQERSRPLVDALQPWRREKLSPISQKTKLAEAIRYALSRWAGLCLFLEDGRIEIDNNAVERAIRPLALNRKNALFAGSHGGAEHWAVIASLIETCKLLGVTSPTSLPASSTAIPKAASTSSCPGPIRRRRNSKPWPENTAYKPARRRWCGHSPTWPRM
jgi:hypothetical protein